MKKTDKTSWQLPEKGKQFEELFKKAGKEHGIPWALLARIAQQESSFNPTAKSPVGAYGLMQFMEPTANEWNVDRADPASSIDGAARYLKWLKKNLGSWDKALAGYNWGIGNVKRKGIEKAPEETRNYVNNILHDVNPDREIQAMTNVFADMEQTDMFSPAKSGLQAFFDKPSNQRFLAELGAAADPGGAGGIIGAPTVQAIERQETAKAMGKIGKNVKSMLPYIMQALLGDTPLSEVSFDEFGNPTKLKATPPTPATSGQSQLKTDQDDSTNKLSMMDSLIKKLTGL